MHASNRGSTLQIDSQSKSMDLDEIDSQSESLPITGPAHLNMFWDIFIPLLGLVSFYRFFFATQK